MGRIAAAKPWRWLPVDDALDLRCCLISAARPGEKLASSTESNHSAWPVRPCRYETTIEKAHHMGGL